MAWMSSGNTNDELVSMLTLNNIISTSSVIQAFREVDRSLFVSSRLKKRAYKDQPLRDGLIHLSAPHIYGSALEALEIEEGVSFLNIGSGTGYMSSLVGAISGKQSINHGLEVHEELVEMAKKACQVNNNIQISSLDIKMETPENHSDNDDDDDENILLNHENNNQIQHDITEILSEFPPKKKVKKHINKKLPLCEFKVGDAFLIDSYKHMKYDRIYIGAGAPDHMMDTFQSLLKPFGILVGPFGDKLLKIRSRGNGKYTQTCLSTVAFAPLRPPTSNVLLKCYFKEPAWNFKRHLYFPVEFQESIFNILLIHQRPESKLFHLPFSICLHMISFMHKDWFQRELTPIEYLEKTLEVETHARELAEARAIKAEDDRDKFRLLVLRQQHQIEVLLNRIQTQRNYQQSNNTTDMEIDDDENEESTHEDNNQHEEEDQETSDNEAEHTLSIIEYSPLNFFSLEASSVENHENESNEG